MRSIILAVMLACSFAYSQPNDLWQPPAEGAGDLHYNFDADRPLQEPAEGANLPRQVFQRVRLPNQHRMDDNLARMPPLHRVDDDACQNLVSDCLVQTVVNLFVYPPFRLSTMMLLGVEGFVSSCLPSP